MKFDKDDYKYFTMLCDALVADMGLKSIQMSYYHKPMPDAYATMSYRHEAQSCTITLSSSNLPSDIDKESELIDTAQHEMLELLLAPLQAMITNKSEDCDIEAEVHGLIHRLQGMIWK